MHGGNLKLTLYSLAFSKSSSVVYKFIIYIMLAGSVMRTKALSL